MSWDLDDLRARKQSLELRLADGRKRIDAAEQQGRDVEQWEMFWLTLLSEYEQLCDEFRLEGVTFERIQPKPKLMPRPTPEPLPANVVPFPARKR